MPVILNDAPQKSVQTAKEPAKLRAEETKIREMQKAGTLSPDIAQAALDALGQKRRRMATALNAPAARSIEMFTLGVERYSGAVRNLRDHVAKSPQAGEERTLVHELLGGRGIVFARDGRIGARFQSEGLIEMAELPYKSSTYNYGSGGRI